MQPLPPLSEPTPLSPRGFFRSLYDFKFASFITSRVIRIVYALVVVLYTIFAILSFIVLLVRGGAIGVVMAIIVVPLVYIIELVFARLLAEFLMVVFRISEDVHAMRNRGSQTAQ